MRVGCLGRAVGGWFGSHPRALASTFGDAAVSFGFAASRSAHVSGPFRLRLNIMHLDIKPANLFPTSTGRQASLALLAFRPWGLRAGPCNFRGLRLVTSGAPSETMGSSAWCCSQFPIGWLELCKPARQKSCSFPHPPRRARQLFTLQKSASSRWGRGRFRGHPRIPRDGGQLCIPCVPRSAHRWLLTFGRLGFASTAF